MFIIMALCDNEDSRQFFIDLYRDYRPLMYRMAYSYVQNPSTAEDLVHDALVKLIEKENTITKFRRCTLTSYIVYTIRNLSKNYLRRQSLEQQYFVDVDINSNEFLVVDNAPLPEEVMLMSERRAEFIEIWDSLPDDTKILLESKYILGLSDEELATEFDCSPNSIRMKLTRARRQVIKLVKEGGFSFEPA